jgi:cellulose synthase/poly-beta-1,6-N-acetylglucosamine synthase-like glycosyltransferase
MPFQALVDVGFWQNDIVTEDSRICLQCFQHYDGDYEVTPMYIPVSMDVVLGKSIWETMKSQYVQQRRWAYGVENFPYMAWNFIPNTRMPLAKKLRYMWNQTEGVYSWATAPILILILGRLPLWLLNNAERQTALALNTPYILEILMRISLIGIIVAAFLGSTLLPKRPSDVPIRRILYMVLQWPLLIVSMIVFGAIPATDAQTRLMLGRYLGFDVTRKFRKRKEAT